VLSASRHLFVRPTLVMDQTEWVAAHVAAAAFFGGLPARIVLDYVPRNIIEVLFPPALCALEAARRHPPASPGGERLEATKAGHITLREMPAT